MKIGLVSSAVPHIQGGARMFVDQLAPHLEAAGHRVERIYLPFTSDRETLLSEIASFRMMDLESACDMIICSRTPAHVVKHPNKVLWFIHHERVFYDLWDSGHSPIPQTAYWENVRDVLIEADTRALKEARAIFTNSAVVSERLRKYNGLNSEVLYPPITNPERFQCGDYGPEILFVCRLESHKRQHLAIEAMAHTKTPVRLRIAGASGSDYASRLRKLVAEHGLEDRVSIDNRWISEGEKIYLLSTALACVYIPLDEDSYGYPTLEAAHARRAMVTVADAGGVREFVEDGVNGLVTEPSPEELARAFDLLWRDRKLAAKLGAAAERQVSKLNIGWDHVVARLTA